MKVTYYALRSVQIGDEMRQLGDLIPEANNWPYLSSYIAEGKIAPVLVASLPEDTQLMLLEWEADQIAPVTVPAPEPTPKKEKP